ncbi:hypothetical protein Tco_0963600 [Tanacetum coccineum]
MMDSDSYRRGGGKEPTDNNSIVSNFLDSHSFRGIVIFYFWKEANSFRALPMINFTEFEEIIMNPEGDISSSQFYAHSDPFARHCTQGNYITRNQEDLKVVNQSYLQSMNSVGKVFTNIRYIWRPTGRTFTIVGNVCPLTRITTTTEVPLRKPTDLENETPKPVVTLVYSRKPRKSKTNVPVSKSKIVKIVFWYLDFGCSKHMTEDRSQLTNFVNKFLGTITFGNDHVAKILGYGDYQIRNATILRVYYVEDDRCMDKTKNNKKTVKNGQTRTREWKSTKEAGESSQRSKREGFYQSKGGKDNSSSQVHNGREKDVILIEEAQSRLTHGCHIGNPCVPNMIQFSSNDWKNGWQRLMGAWVDLKRLEGSLRGYK